MGCDMRKPAFCICENNGADQLCGNEQLISASDFATYVEQLSYVQNLKFLVIFCGCIARFVSDMVGTAIYRFSCNAVHTLAHPIRLQSFACPSFSICGPSGGQTHICHIFHEKANILHKRKQNADQLRCNREADQSLCFRYINSTIPLPLNPKFQSSSPSSVAVQSGWCRTRSETRTLVFA